MQSFHSALESTKALWVLWREDTGRTLPSCNLNNMEHAHNYRIRNSMKAASEAENGVLFKGYSHREAQGEIKNGD